MSQQTKIRSPWVRLSSIAVAILGLVVVSILLLSAGPVQARLQGPEQQVPAGGGTSPAQLGTRVLSMTVEATSTVVVPGQWVTYTIEMVHQGGYNIADGSLYGYPRPPLDAHWDALEVVQLGGQVWPDQFAAQYWLWPGPVSIPAGMLTWVGGMTPDSSFVIRYPAQILPCSDPELVTVENTVAWDDQETHLVARAEIQVDCDGAVDPAYVSASHSFFSRNGERSAFAEVMPGTGAYYQIELTNADWNDAAVLGLVGLFPSRSFNIGMPPSLQRTATLGWKVEEGESASNLAPGTQSALFLVPLDPGETTVVTVPIRLVEDVPPESEFEVQLGYCVTHDGRFCPGADPESTVPPASFKWLSPVSLTVRYRDLGDAPDSTSHYSTTMPAYGGVQAAFPTVLDPVTGLDQGPVHLNPRPFHLGRRVSPEAEADVGPDLDPTNNILPLASVANRDRRDDGLALKLLNFSTCQPGLVPVRIVVRSAAVTYFQQTGGKGYLNLWLDGNHDGDWADAFSCPATQRAFEHIVIDHAIDVAALGPGVHTLLVPTGLVPWSGQGAWLRATLSERPSNKTLNTAGIDYGDGRGYTTPFLLGETEDYYLRPPGTEGAGPDMALDLEGGWRTRVPAAEPALSASSPDLEIHLTASYFQAEYRNEGSETAKDVLLRSRFPQSLLSLDPRIAAVPALADGAVTRLPRGFQISLGDVEPGEGGTIVLAWYECLTCTRALAAVEAGADITGSVTIESSDDVNLANNEAGTSVKVPELVEIGFTSLLGSFLRTSGASCHNDITLRGRAAPNTQFDLLARGSDGAQILGVLSADGSGTLEQTINLANGRYQIFLIPKAAQSGTAAGDTSASPESVSIVKRIDKATPALNIVVNNHLPWNPSSLVFIDSQGRAIQPMALGFENQAGWYGHLKAGETYQVSVEYCGTDPAATIQARFQGQTISLVDLLGDGVFVGQFVAGASAAEPAQVAASAPFTMSITSGSLQTIFGGTIQATSEGVVYDSGTGQPLRAKVVLLQAIDGDPEAGFDLWTGAAYGQANPQITADDGQYAFWPEPGTYHLDVSRPGYQPYRSWDLQTTGEPINRDLALTPNVTGEPDHVVQIGPDGFEPSVLRVLPGSIVKWVNTGIADHTTTSTDPGLAGPGIPTNGGWDSGRLSSGDSYIHQFAAEGTFAYADRARPGHTAQIQVGGFKVYLPLIVR